MIIHSLTEATDKDRFVHDFGTLPELIREGIYKKALIPSQLRSSLLSIPFSAPREFWIVYENGVPLASLGAVQSAEYKNTGYIGFMEFNVTHIKGKEALNLLINEGLSFLKAHGCALAYGPMQYNTWFPYRFKTSQQELRNFSWEPVNPPEYVEAIKEAGFSDEITYHSTAFGNLDEYLVETQPALDKALSNHYTFRPFDYSRWESDEISTLYGISHGAFKDNFLFEPLPQPLFAALYVQIANKQHQHAYMVINSEGKEVGFVFAFEDVIEHEKYLVIKTLAILPEARGMGISNALTHLVLKDGIANGATYGIAATVRAGIQSESYARKGSFYWKNEYALFKKTLSPR